MREPVSISGVEIPGGWSGGHGSPGGDGLSASAAPPSLILEAPRGPEGSESGSDVGEIVGLFPFF